MKREAIIVVTPNCPKHTKLPGATKDGDEWKSFLMSPEGGAWKDEEIALVSDPTPAFLNAYLGVIRDQKPDYALLTFSGHGYYVKQSNNLYETRMAVSDTAYVTDNTFTVRARRELTIIDACREYGGEVIEENLVNMARSQIALADEGRLQRARAIFDKALLSSPEGRSLIYSCDLNQTADDIQSFTRFLIADGIQLAKNNRTVRTISIKEAFDAAEDKPSKVNYPQKPVYTSQRRITHYPFAVSL